MLLLHDDELCGRESQQERVLGQRPFERRSREIRQAQKSPPGIPCPLDQPRAIALERCHSELIPFYSTEATPLEAYHGF